MIKLLIIEDSEETVDLIRLILSNESDIKIFDTNSIKDSIKKQTGSDSKPTHIGFSDLVGRRLGRIKNNQKLITLLREVEKIKISSLGELPQKGKVKLKTEIKVLPETEIYTSQSDFDRNGIVARRELMKKFNQFYMKANFHDINKYFDANEKEQIIAALQGLEKTNKAYKSELITKLSALFKIKNSNWIEIDFTSWGSNNTYQDLFNALKTTIINKNIISFSYNSSKAEKINRKVKPIRLLFKEQDWYLYGFCLLRNDFRYFKLSRMKDLEVLAINYEDNFENAVLKKELKYENIVNIKLKFDKSVAFRVYDEFNEAIEEDEKGNLYVEIKIPNNYKLYNYIFSFGSNVEILEPKEIRNQFKNMINEIAKKYI